MRPNLARPQGKEAGLRHSHWGQAGVYKVPRQADWTQLGASCPWFGLWYFPRGLWGAFIRDIELWYLFELGRNGSGREWIDGADGGTLVGCCELSETEMRLGSRVCLSLGR